MAAASSADGPLVTMRRARVVAIAAILVVVGLVAPAAPAGSAETPLPPATDGSTPPQPEPPPGVILAPPGADAAGREHARAELKVSEAALKKASAEHRRLLKRPVALEKRRVELSGQLAALEERDRVAGDELVAARARVRQMAVAGYVSGGDVPPVNYLLRSENPTDLVRRHSLVKTATEAKVEAVGLYQAAKDNASIALLNALHELDAVTAEARQIGNEIAVAQRRVDELKVEVDNRKQLLDVMTAAAPVGSSDIPRLFLDAYKRGAAALQKRVPHCRVSWTAVAAIGKVEANHGRYRGARLALNGDVYPRIIGIPLDGTRGTRVIKDTDGGKFDLDTTFDRAVGPMQFIPSTWVRIAQDGNGDGAKDANNAYDAALGTAAYLCRAVPEGGLDAEDKLRRAFFSYNRSEAYVEHVLWWKNGFDSIANQL